MFQTSDPGCALSGSACGAGLPFRPCCLKNAGPSEGGPHSLPPAATPGRFPSFLLPGIKKGRPFSALQTEMDGRICEEISMAEGKGFEPLVGSRPQRFSRPPHSTALPSLRKTAQKALSFLNVIYPGARCQPERPSAAPHGAGGRTGHLSRREAAPEQIRNRLIFFLQTEMAIFPCRS